MNGTRHLQDKATGGGLLHISLDAQFHNTMEEAALWEQMGSTMPDAIVDICAQRQRICQAKTKIRAVAQSYNHVIYQYMHSACALLH